MAKKENKKQVETKVYKRIKDCHYACGKRAKCIDLSTPCPKLRDEMNDFELVETSTIELYMRKRR